MRHELRSINQLLTNQMLSGGTAVAAYTAAQTIVSTDILQAGLITGNPGAAANYTMPTGAVFGPIADAYFSGGWPVNYGYDFTIVNIATNATFIITVVGASGMTAVGNMAIAANAATPASNMAARLRIIKTAANTYSFYRIA
jgi:hypothetical protein